LIILFKGIGLRQAIEVVPAMTFLSGYSGSPRYYGKTTFTYNPLPTLDVLRAKLAVPEVNSGRKILMGPYGLVSGDLERLHAYANENGRVVLSSGVEMPMAVYRGQSEDFQQCLPTLARMAHIEDQLLALCRNTAFEDAISDHPYVRYCEQTNFMGLPLNTDRQGLAQHYGLSTDLLDLTSNFDVATFFATCRWNADSRSYQPVKFATRPGVLYRLRPFLFVGMDQTAELHWVGWQPLHRPEQQRACAIRLKKGLDLDRLTGVEKVLFRHSAKTASRIWKSFDEGRALFPVDAAAELAEQAGRLMEFTRGQIDRSWSKLDDWNVTETTMPDRQRVEGNVDLSITDKSVLSWDGFNILRDETIMRDQLREILDRVRVRMAADHCVS
jgi:hypothetical protein